MTTFYLLRHGAVDWQPGCFLGQTDALLSREGRTQAGFWRDGLAGTAFDQVWCSDLSRTVETARIIFDGRKEKIRPCRDLREIHLGDWEGVPRSDIRKSFPGLYDARGRDLAGFRPPGGESFGDLQNRVVSKVTEIAEANKEKVCLVVHAGVIRVLICHCLEMALSNLFRIQVDYAGLSIVRLSQDAVEVRAVNIRPHGQLGRKIE